MACIAGRLRAARLSAALAADTPSTSAAACGLIQTSSSDFYPAWLGLPWTAARSIAASSAHHDSPTGAGGDSRRPDNSSRRRQRPSDRSDASAQRLGVGPQQPSSRASQSRREGSAEQRPRGSPNSPRDSDSRQTARPRWDRGPGGPASASASSPRGASSPAPAMLQLQPRDPHQQQQQQQQQQNPERWDLVVRNAQQRVLQLIGDPRTGVADDTTTNPFGEVTVDMVHYQPSNEVYWFKYEFAGAATHGSHRDARLSDYTRNLMYLLRAKDPKRWTIQALADKFRIRKQRVLAILALKELEAQRIEDGKLLGGPLSAYALPVRTQDIHLEPHTGNPRLVPQPPRQQQQQQQQPLPAAEDGTLSESVPSAEAEAAAPRALDDHVDVVLPRVVAAAQKMQLQLVDLLGQYGYDSNRIRTAFLADLDRAAEMAAAVLGGDEYLKEDLQSYRTAIEAVVAAVEEVVAASPLLLEERRAAAMRSAVDAALAAAGEAVLREAAEATTTTTATATTTSSGGGGEGEPAAAAPSEGLLAVRQKLTEVLAPVLEGAGDDGGRALQRAFFTLSPKTRGSVLRLLPEISIRLSAAGVDLARAAKEAAYRGPEAAAAASAAAAAAAGGSAASSGGGALPPRQLSVDIFGFAPVPERQAAAVVSALESLEAARSALVAKVVALDPEPLGAAAKTAAAAPAASDTRLARSLVRQYVATDAMWADLLAPSQSVVERRLALPSVDPARKRRMLEVLHEADPTALTRALQVEAAMQLRFRNAAAEADALAAGVGVAAAAAAAAAEPGAGQGAAGEGEGQQGQSQGQQGQQGRPGDVASWDALAAFLEARVAGKVYGSGSGERHVARLPTYPAFEGYSLEEFDRAGESELSALNRKLAESLDEQMYDRFRNDLLFNLGVRGEKLRLSSHETGPWPSNLRTELTRPVVVYGINADGTTQYPPLYVATGDGRTRPLNEQEKVFQERREIRPRLPYYMGRIRRMPELD